MATVSKGDWFDNCGGFDPAHDLAVLRRGIAAGLLDEQDEWGMTALHLAVTSEWLAGVRALLKAGANPELRYFRTGETALHSAAEEGDEALAAALLAAGANPDAANYWGLTPRKWNARLFAQIPKRPVDWPAWRVQNAEHLADHYYPRFKIPGREERETLKPGQAVDLYVYGPKSKNKQDTVKVRISKRGGRRPNVTYIGTVESPTAQTHLPAGITELEFAPEHVATVYVPRTAVQKPTRPTKRAKSAAARRR